MESFWRHSNAGPRRKVNTAWRFGAAAIRGNMTDAQREFLDKASAAATQSTHPFPRMAASEAALESGYGLSGLASEDNNLFGMKQHMHPEYGTVSLPTREFEKGEWVEVSANWVKYPDWTTCFFDRLSTLVRLSNVYPHYAAALHATDALTFVQEVSQTWSTDPGRAEKVLAIYNAYVSLAQATPQGAA
jgi:flagellum-specific peptidoglycan hydrolase FlgJ